MALHGTATAPAQSSRSYPDDRNRDRNVFPVREPKGCTAAVPAIHIRSYLAGMSLLLQLQTVDLATASIELFVPDAMAMKEAYHEGRIEFPYWSQVWPAAKALATFLLQHPEYTRGKHVLELGAGLGLPSLVAARNAAHVLCTDHAADSVAVVKQSADHLQLQNLTTRIVDWQNLPQDIKADVLLLSDINYDPAAFNTLQKLVDSFLQQETTVILSTPPRLMAKAFVAPLLNACTWQEELMVQHHEEEVGITVMVLEKRSFPA
jgi:predicted nicotinamide N-methyase